MEREATLSRVREIMTSFAEDTGLTSDRPPRRYLWTDAFAVCNLVELERQTGDAHYRELALRLVDQVHHVLGRHRPDDPRSGWISGLDEEEGEQYPTAGGLRIGKELNEREPDEPWDRRLEWDRDGQYFHYLTKWMHALNRVSQVTGEPVYNRWAMELAKTAHARFTYPPASGGPSQMVWKMSIDLTYTLVDFMGQQDPLDGLVTYQTLQARAPSEATAPDWPDLQEESAEMAWICEGIDFATNDPLGLGGILSDAYRTGQLIREGHLSAELLQTLLDAALVGLELYISKDDLRMPASYRLAFRELGLVIGLQAGARLQDLLEQHPEAFDRQQLLTVQVKNLMRYGPLIEEIEQFWLRRENQESESWTAHEDINSVTLATSLAPDGYLAI
jgi:hypothetical protein